MSLPHVPPVWPAETPQSIEALLILEPTTRMDSLALLALLRTRLLRTHPFAPDAQRRPGETAVRTALSPRYLIRMRSQVQVLAGPPTIVAGQSAVGSAVTCGNSWWACQDLNLGPHPYQGSAPGLVSAGSHLRPAPGCTVGDRCEPLGSDGMWTKRGPDRYSVTQHWAPGGEYLLTLASRVLQGSG